MPEPTITESVRTWTVDHRSARETDEASAEWRRVVRESVILIGWFVGAAVVIAIASLL